MILVDTSVWIDHFRSSNASLVAKLGNGEVLSHPFVIGELACGSLHRRGNVLAYLSALPAAACARNEEVLKFIETHKLWGKGLGWTDTHLLAAARLSHSKLWTLDKALQRAATQLGV